MAKMYISDEEAAQQLGVDQEGLMELVNSARLQMYQDGAKHVFRASDVEELAGQLQADQSATEGEAAETGPTEVPPAVPAEEQAPAPAGESPDFVPMEQGESAIDLSALGEQADDTGETVVETGGSTADLVSLEESESTVEGLAPPTPSEQAQAEKEDTVLTAEGISIFDDEDLEIEEADPMAKTQIAPSLDDQIALDGVGSGSGLLDLTRESDDTSLGAEVLDNIDMDNIGGSTISSGLGEAIPSGLENITTSTEAAPAAAAYTTAPAEPPEYVESVDASSGLFTGVLVGVSLIMLVILFSAVAAQQGVLPSILQTMHENLLIVVAVVVVLTAVGAVVGMTMGKSAQARQRALRRGA
jgi:hypothetical protein